MDDDEEDWSPRSIFDGEDDAVPPLGAFDGAGALAHRKVEDAAIHGDLSECWGTA